MSVATLDNLSALHKKLLRDALMAHYRKPLDNEGQVEDPGCFTIRTVGRIPEPDGFDLKRRKASAEERRKRASWRAASGRAVARLLRRGFVECCSRGHWQFTSSGLAVARKLWPLVKPMTKREVASAIAFREAVHSVVPRRRLRPRTKKLSPKAPERIADPEAGIEIPFDF